MNRLLRLHLIAPLLLASTGSHAQPKDVLSSLAATDQAISSGRLSFTHLTTRLGGGFAQPQSPGEAALDAKLRRTASRNTLVYSDRARYALDTVLTYADGGRQHVRECYDGKQQLIQNTETKEVSILPGKPTGLGTASCMVGVQAGASFPLGRGLSILSNAQIRRVPGLVTVSGVAPDSSSVSAQVDPAHGWVARSIERRDRAGHLVARYSLQKPVKLDGQWLASGATYETFLSTGAPVTREEYRLLSAVFRVPTDDEMGFAVPQGWTIVDGRLGRPIMAKKLSPGTITADELLPKTRAQAAREASLLGRVRDYEQLERIRKGAIVGLPIVIVIGTLAVRRAMGRQGRMSADTPRPAR